MSDRYLGYKLLLGVLLLVALTGCNQDIFYKNTQGIEDGIWRYEDPKTFTFTAEDTLTSYDLLIEVKHDSRFPFQNLYMQLNTELPGNKTVKDVLSIDLADRSGNKYGVCRGDKCTFRIPVQQSFRFDQAGPHTINIAQHSRMDSLPGILAIGLTIKETTTE